jgi:hypothetical protein
VGEIFDVEVNVVVGVLLEEVESTSSSSGTTVVLSIIFDDDDDDGSSNTVVETFDGDVVVDGVVNVLSVVFEDP